MLITCVDASNSNTRVARVRLQSLPPSFRLARFIQNISNPSASWHEDNSPDQWEGIQRNPFTDDWQILWFGRKLKGTIPDWGCLPEMFTTLNLGVYSKFGLTHYNYLTGCVNFAALHHELQSLALSGNSFSGTFDAERLPPSLRFLGLRDNNFEGPLCLNALPPHLQTLSLRGNQFSGKVSFDALPKSLQKLTISKGLDINGSVPRCVQIY